METRSRMWASRGIRILVALVAAAVIPACGNSDAGGGGGLTFTSRGGSGLAGTLGNGGIGGSFEIYAYSGNDVKVLTSGTVNAVVALPAVTVPYLGTNVADITTNTTWNVGGELAASSTTVTSGGTVTGVRVRPGVTLTIQPNYDDVGGDTFRDTVRVAFANGVLVEGTILIDFQDLAAPGDGLSNNCSRFYISGENLVISGTGRILVKGKDVVGGVGGNGGLFDDSGVTGTVINAGVLSTAGGNGDTGGNGGGLYFGYGSNYGAYNNGTLTSSGGTGSNGNGGNAGTLYFHADDGYGPCANNGSLLAVGGDGATGGGNGGYTDLYSYYGLLASSGLISTAGGSATVAANNGNGGTGGDLYIYSYGEVRFSGSLVTAGGNGAGTTGDGGSGGYIKIYGDEDYDWGYGEYTTFGMYIGCSINTNGGNGEYGGDAGLTYIYRYDEGVVRPGQEPVLLVGYATIDLSGGDGSVNGGNAGGSNYLFAGEDNDETSTYHIGSLIVSSNIIAVGGKGGTGTGGNGGYVDLETEVYAYTTQNSTYGVTTSGVIDTSGGSGDTTGGNAGGIYVYGRFLASNTGSLLANGGAGNTGNGGSAQDVEIYSSLKATSTGTLSANGGASTAANGSGGSNIYVAGLSTTVGGALSANGGNAGLAGGNGGYIEIVSQENPTVYSGSASVLGGTGTPAGIKGDFWLDGIHVSGP